MRTTRAYRPRKPRRRGLGSLDDLDNRLCAGKVHDPVFAFKPGAHRRVDDFYFEFDCFGLRSRRVGSSGPRGDGKRRLTSRMSSGVPGGKTNLRILSTERTPWGGLVMV